MQTPVEIDFQGMAGSAEIRDDIAKRVAELEERYGRVTACRVVLKGDPAGTTAPAGFTRSTSALRSRTGGKSMSRAPHRRTNGIPTLILRSTMPSSGRAGACRSVCAECKGR